MQQKLQLMVRFVRIADWSVLQFVKDPHPSSYIYGSDKMAIRSTSAK